MAGHADTAPQAHSHVGRYVIVWVGLMVLTAATWGLSTIHIPGGAGIAVALGIASAKGALVALFFMHLWDQQGANRLVFVTSLVFVSLLIGLVLLDNSTRFPLANPPDAETTPVQLRESVLGRPNAPGPPAAAPAPHGG
jgi:cytochrome c oxidase subunit 4